MSYCETWIACLVVNVFPSHHARVAWRSAPVLPGTWPQTRVSRSTREAEEPWTRPVPGGARPAAGRTPPRAGRLLAGPSSLAVGCGDAPPHGARRGAVLLALQYVPHGAGGARRDAGAGRRCAGPAGSTSSVGCGSGPRWGPKMMIPTASLAWPGFGGCSSRSSAARPWCLRMNLISISCPKSAVPGCPKGPRWKS
jgi:hypothetical protein